MFQQSTLTWEMTDQNSLAALAALKKNSTKHCMIIA